MIGIIKSEDWIAFELHPVKCKWGFSIPYTKCKSFGEYGIRFSKSGLEIHWGHSGYFSFSDFIKSEFLKKTK